ncbi:protein serine/threonine phosphatase [Cyberlindnera jadinii NRRL Y-1542]|uniref:Serine/threonine-protein phosphatase n=1 Tax=Cyberlindnera jadinii (strain ATCC 18201 / CBS 1600 / BCRC 20928 / JCM 3617 / NBRC 0987 / NRRL Y-1542) TaxID=983966 RepID=A0A1E4S4L5_CYBJN|nr:protein phosphatase 5 [Cyberlindnera jadinii NRRL Y-1542]ODV74466.1 protein phosphatase 5 [Cyberlindnera jadinii NRRL Y-1542]
MAEEAKLKGNKALQANQFLEAVDHYTEAIRLNDSNAIYYANRAQAEIKLEQYGAAIADCDKSLEVDPTYFKALYRRGVAKSMLLRYKEAYDDFAGVLKLKPSDANTKRLQNEMSKHMRRIAFEKAIQSEDEDVFDFDLEHIPLEQTYEGPKLDITFDKETRDVTLGGLTDSWMQELIKFYKDGGKLPRKYLYALLMKAHQVLKQEPAYKEIKTSEIGDFTVVGDVHGQYYDLINMFTKNGFVHEKHGYLFNGDLVDRGSWSVEVIVTLLFYKILYPDHLHINRGNHETDGMNKMFGFADEVKHKHGAKPLAMFQEIFTEMPLLTLINDDYLVMHGGLISNPTMTLAELKDKVTKLSNPREGVEMELLWSDPQEEEGFGTSKRGIAFQFGPDITRQFCDTNNLKAIIRSHEVRMGGYSEEHDGKCITVFSAPNYCDSTGNIGAVINFKDELEYFTFEAVEHPAVPPMAYTSQRF